MLPFEEPALLDDKVKMIPAGRYVSFRYLGSGTAGPLGQIAPTVLIAEQEHVIAKSGPV